uniref:Uncharacterized protein n=1 Tax=Arion vulgaris TaxID=1028688 RepID=A0A0B7BM49_9EUPU
MVIREVTAVKEVKAMVAKATLTTETIITEVTKALKIMGDHSSISRDLRVATAIAMATSTKVKTEFTSRTQLVNQVVMVVNDSQTTSIIPGNLMPTEADSSRIMVRMRDTDHTRKVSFVHHQEVRDNRLWACHLICHLLCLLCLHTHIEINKTSNDDYYLC